MKKLVILFLGSSASLISQTSLNFTVTNASWSYSITCATPQLTLMASSDHTAPVSYHWQGPGVSSTGTNIVVNSPGNYTVHAMAGSLSAQQIIAIGINTTIPVSVINPTYITVTSTSSPITMTVTTISPVVNLTQFLYTPTGFTNVTNGYIANYTLASIGNYTHCTQNDNNGCRSCQEIIVTFVDALSESKNSPNKVFIFPNPAKDKIYLEFQNERVKNDLMKVQIIDSFGSLLKEEEIQVTEKESKTKHINTSELPDGIYFLKLISVNNELFSKKFLISR